MEEAAQPIGQSNLVSDVLEKHDLRGPADGLDPGLQLGRFHETS